MAEYSIQYFKSADGTSIASARGGSGPPLLVVPPFGFTIENTWKSHASSFREFELITYDRRGTGLSDRGNVCLDPDRYVEDVEAIIEGFHLSQFALFGTLTGAVEATMLAMRLGARVTDLVLRSPVSDFADWASLPGVRAGRAAMGEDWDYFTESFAQFVLGWGKPGAPNLAAIWRANTTASELGALMDAFQKLDLVSAFPRITARSLVEHNPDYFFRDTYSRRIAALIPDCHMVMFPEGGDFRSDFSLSRDFLLQRGAHGPSGDQPGTFRTLLFTDLEGHTAMMSRLGDVKGREVLREHERITREALAAHGGQEIKTMGDGFMASFGSAQRALECAAALQRAVVGGIGGEALRIRAGINAGEPISEHDDLFGSSVIAAARIASKAQGGQVLVSDVVRQLVAGKGFLFADAGIQELKGLDEPVRLWELRWEGA